MSLRLLGSSLGLIVFLGFVSCSLAAEDNGSGHGADVVSAEADPDQGADVGGAHAAADGQAAGGHGGGVHNPFEDALHANAGPQQQSPAEWKQSLALWTLVVFGCLMTVLWKFAWGPIRDALDGREKSIQASIDAAKAQNEKAAALLADHEARLAGTADEVRRILDEARRDAETQKQGILAEAQTAAESEKNRALQEIDAAKNGALQELAQKTVDIGVDLAGKIVQRQLSPGDHASLISEAIKHFPSKN